MVLFEKDQRISDEVKAFESTSSQQIKALQAELRNKMTKLQTLEDEVGVFLNCDVRFSGGATLVIVCFCLVFWYHFPLSRRYTLKS